LIFTVRRYAGKVYAVALCPSVRPSVCMSQLECLMTFSDLQGHSLISSPFKLKRLEITNEIFRTLSVNYFTIMSRAADKSQRRQAASRGPSATAEFLVLNGEWLYRYDVWKMYSFYLSILCRPIMQPAVSHKRLPVYIFLHHRGC